MADLSKEYDRVSNSEEMTQLIRSLSKGVGEDVFDEDLKKLEKRLQDISGWVVDASLELEKLPTNPESFDDILATIEPERTKKVKKFRFELEQLKERRNNVTEEHEEYTRVKKFSDRIFDIVANERKVKVAIKSLQDAADKRIETAACMFKKRIKQFKEEYWHEAEVTRRVLEKAQKASSRRLPKNLDADGAKKLMAATIRDRATAERETGRVIKLSRLGGFIARMPREEGAQDIKIDSADMKKLYENAITKTNKRIQLLKKTIAELKNKEQAEKCKQYDDEHKKEYMNLLEWSDMKLNEVVNLGQEAKTLVRSPRKGRMTVKRLDAIVESMEDLFKVDVPKKEIAIKDRMANTSTLLEDLKYGRIRMIKDREDKVRESLKKLSNKAQEELEKVIARREGKQVSPKKRKIEEKKTQKLEHLELDEGTTKTKQRSLKEATRDLEQWTTSQADERSPSPKKRRERKEVSSPKENEPLSKEKSLSVGLAKTATYPLKEEKKLSEKLVNNASSQIREEKANKQRGSISRTKATSTGAKAVGSMQDQLVRDENFLRAQSSISSASASDWAPFQLAVLPSISFPPGFFDIASSRSVSHQTPIAEQSVNHLMEELEKLQGEFGDLQRQVAKLQNENINLLEEKQYLELENSTLAANQTNSTALHMLAISNEV